MNNSPELEWTFVEVCPTSTYSSTHFKFLYEILKERLKYPDENISHKSLPSYEEHINFCYSHPYLVWYVIVNAQKNDACIGSVYMSKDFEIGIHIAEGHQKRGIGKDAVEHLLSMYPKLGTVKANINPHNKRSIEFFKKLGFVYHSELRDHNGVLVQITFSKVI